jgi:hypothetical protein
VFVAATKSIFRRTCTGENATITRHWQSQWHPADTLRRNCELQLIGLMRVETDFDLIDGEDQLAAILEVDRHEFAVGADLVARTL